MSSSFSNFQPPATTTPSSVFTLTNPLFMKMQNLLRTLRSVENLAQIYMRLGAILETELENMKRGRCEEEADAGCAVGHHLFAVTPYKTNKILRVELIALKKEGKGEGWLEIVKGVLAVLEEVMRVQKEIEEKKKAIKKKMKIVRRMDRDFWELMCQLWEQKEQEELEAEIRGLMMISLEE